MWPVRDPRVTASTCLLIPRVEDQMRLAVYGQNGEHIGEVASDEWGEMALYDSPWKLNDDLIEAIDDLLNRSLKGYQANAKSYSKEELVAELGGAIMASHFGVSVDYDNSAAYLEGWLSKFEGSPDLLHHALRDADKAIRMILDHEGLS